jgi:hypothetical protein
MNKPVFNRPVLYTSLLSEQIMDVNGNHAIYSSVVADEFTIRTPDALLNGLATQLYIQNCVPDLINPGKIQLCDIQQLLASIKIASQGANLEVLLRCPHCKANDPYEINLQQSTPFLSAKKWFSPLTIDNFVITFRSPTYEEFTHFSIEEFKISKQLYQISIMETPDDYNDAIASLLSQKIKLNLDFETLCISSVAIDENTTVINHNHIVEWFSQCEIFIQKQILEYLDAAKKEGWLTDFSIDCSECKKNFKVPIDLDPCVQFRNQLISASESEVIDIIKRYGEETKALSNDLLKMCRYMHGSISYSEAYALTTHERECIAKIIEDNIELTKESGMSFM